MVSETNVLDNIESLLEIMPWYVKDYYFAKNVARYSKKTLYEYLNEYRRFFRWLIESDISHASTISEIDIEELENLSLKDAQAFFVFLRERPLLNTTDKKKQIKGLSETAIKRSHAALSSLWKYLTEETENEDGEPLFYRNVMKKISFKYRKATLSARASAIKDKLFLGDETQKFLEFIDDDNSSEGYVAKANLSPRALSSYRKNKERDLAFIALMLASGIRLSETVNIDLKDLNLNTMTVSVIRKGDKLDTVPIALFAKKYLEGYLEIREKRYKTAQQDTALFVTTQSGTVKRLGGAAIERTVAKYSQAYKIRVTPHKLRHTLATRLYSSTKDTILTAQQLGHSESSNLVQTYAHVLDDQQADAVRKL
ncbi:tyrosine recombinase XerS (plasmid) [Streptococcus ruminicola]|uniref:Tyrosine recombinase XerS n=1 Tax=Streptococcus ruminicola TaxID=2686210 RepID=A0A6G8I2R6_9STRE|nr:MULTISPECIES: tyrosine recombinase XerS [Streptococcus]QGX47351.1 tyrosine recombinase XerS [Streptococcus equinus]QIM47400.1 tyrosine recombinase XerS [Streptococcus ruminicola]